MRGIAGSLVVIAMLAGSSGAEEMYRWKDASGRLHFANVPTADRRGPAPAAVSEEANAGREGPADESAPPGDDAAYSTSVSSRRSTLERELRATQRRVKDLDGRLATLAAVRTKNARGSAATGGVAAPSHDVLSPEEEELLEEREQLAEQADGIRSDAAELRQEVEGRLGAVPAWWTDLH